MNIHMDEVMDCVFDAKKQEPEMRSEKYQNAFKEEIAWLVKDIRENFSARIYRLDGKDIRTGSKEESKNIKAWMLCSEHGIIRTCGSDEELAYKEVVFIGTREMAVDFFKNLTDQNISDYHGEEVSFQRRKGVFAGYPYLFAVSMYGDVQFCPFTKEYSAAELRKFAETLDSCTKSFEKTEKKFYKDLYLSEEEAAHKWDTCSEEDREEDYE